MPPTVEPWILRSRHQVGSRIRSLRVWRNLSQEALAHKADIGRYTVVRAELGLTNLSHDNAVRMAKALDVPVAWFFADDWSTPPGGGCGGGEQPPAAP